MYIDPNTGGMLFQVLATLLAVFSGFALLFSGKIRAFIARSRRSLRKEPVEQTGPSDDQPAANDPSQDNGSPS